MKILLIEDDNDGRAVTALALRLHGIEVEPFADVPSAIAALEEGLSVDAIVLDWVLPCYPGQWFLEKCDFQGLARGVPVVILTGYGPLAEGAEVAAILLKPVNVDELVMTLKEVAAPAWRRRQRREGAFALPPRAPLAEST